MTFSTDRVYAPEQKDLLGMAAKLENRHVRCTTGSCGRCAPRRKRQAAKAPTTPLLSTAVNAKVVISQ